ncbi:MAG: SurA N-terminal domain-containing protein [Burkholderiaceae bacterium]|nr:SurA N-terminal domain-containing protein [Burkholderiaceae bacterium]
MFDSIRKHQRLMQFLLLILIFPAFVFFGVSGYDRFLSDEGAVATVGGSKITRQELDTAMRRQFEQMRQVLGDRADPRILDTPRARAEVLDGLVAQRVLFNTALEARVLVSDEQLRQTILDIPGLKGADGVFDKARYRTLLSGQGLTEAGFEQQLRRDLMVQALPQAIARSGFVSNSLLDRIIALQEQVREVRELAFKPADFSASVKPSDDELRRHYEENARAYEIPESVRIEYVVLSAAAIAQTIAPDAAEVRAYYDQNRARYGTPEERKASHILIRLDPSAGEQARKDARAKADKLLAQAREGSDFAALARASSEDPGSAASGGDLGFFTRETMVKPFADAAFALKEGQISDLVESEFGLHVIRLTAIKPSSVKPFEAVRAEIENALREQQATRRFAQDAEGFTNIVYEQADSLKPAADKFKLEVRNAEMTREGPVASGDKVLTTPKLADALFSPDSLRTKRNTEAIEAGGNTLVSARVVEHRPAKRRPFEEVKAAILERVVQEQASKLAVKAGEERLKTLRDGGPASDLGAPRSLSRAATSDADPALLEAVFRAPVGKLPAVLGVNLGAQGYVVVQVVKVTEPSAQALAARREAYRDQIASLVAQQQGNDLIESLKARSKVALHAERKTNPSDAR